MHCIKVTQLRQDKQKGHKKSEWKNSTKCKIQQEQKAQERKKPLFPLPQADLFEHKPHGNLAPSFHCMGVTSHIYSVVKCEEGLFQFLHL